MKIVKGMYKKSKTLKQHDIRNVAKHMSKIRLVLYYFLLENASSQGRSLESAKSSTELGLKKKNYCSISPATLKKEK